MPHSVSHRTKSTLSTNTISQRSIASHVSKSSAPTSLRSESSSKDYTQTQNSICEKVIDFSPLSPVVTRPSTDAYTCTDSDEGLDVADDESLDNCGYPSFLQLRSRVITTELRASNPSSFAEHFPSSRILSICHDALSSDNHLNLRVDVEDRHHRGMLQLFHLWIQDLQMRRFSLRRYERSSGREVCKTARKQVATTPVLPHSVSAALSHIKLPSSIFLKKLRPDTNSFGGRTTLGSSSSIKSCSNLIATNVIRMEFSNYAQVEVKCRSSRRLGKRYEFEYWGHQYVWRRVGKRDSKYKGVSYHLNRAGHASACAYIVSDFQNQWQKYQEQKAGHWVPPCGMWITEIPLTDGSDVAE